MFNWLFGKKKKVEEVKKVAAPSKPFQKYATPVRTSTPPITLNTRPAVTNRHNTEELLDHSDVIDSAVNMATELAYQHHISYLLNNPEPVSYGETVSSVTTPDTTPDTTASYSAPDTSSYSAPDTSSSYDSGSSYSGSDSSYSSSGGDF